MKAAGWFSDRRCLLNLPLITMVLSTGILGVLVVSGGGPLHAQATDTNGLITSDQWLILGPFQEPFGCNGSNDSILGNHIAPSNIACQFPEDGNEIAYDSSQSVTTAYVGPTSAAGKPQWRLFSDGTNDGDQDLDADVGGNLSTVMSFLATYIQYKGTSPTLVQLCIGSDDGVQVWFDNKLVHNNNACRGRGVCQDTVGVVVSPGVHCIKMGIWENAGGWGGSLGLQTQGGEQPITDDAALWPDWLFLGPSGVVSIPNCTPPTEFPGRIIGVNCIKRVDGGLDLTWANPPDANTGVPISIWVNGVQVATAPGTATSATVPANKLPDQNAAVCLVNSSGLPSCCSAHVTDSVGLIKTSHWLVLGPFAETFGCNNNNASILGNHIAPSCIQGQYPVAGSEIEYEPGRAVTSAYLGPTSAGGKPFWREFDDGSDNGDQDLDADVTGGQSLVMSWLATYIEYKGAAPASVDLCVGSDDGVQVWIDDQLAHNNNACRGRATCQDIVPVTISKGPHRIAVGIWENAGGWGGSLGLQQAGTPIVDDPVAFPDWQYWGRTKPPGFVDIPCPSCLEPVTNVNCKIVTGLPSGLEVTWTNPPGCDLPTLGRTSIRINGTEQANVAASQTRAVVANARLPAGILAIEVVNSSSIPASCCFQKTDDLGLVRTKEWLVLGPFAEGFGCNGDNQSILGNHIAPSHICQQYPVAGDEVDYDPAQSVSSAYVGPQSANGKPFWRPFDDGTPCDGDNNLDADVNGNQSLVMSWLATYIEHVGVDPIAVQLCVGSDDGVQIWMDNELVHNNNACRGRATCQDIVDITMSPGVHCLKIGTWENQGGWGCSLGLRDSVSGDPILDDGSRDDFVFHGTQRPGPVSGFPVCVPPCPPVESLSCSLNGGGGINVSWQNPPCDNTPATVSIKVNGNEVGTTAGTATSFTVPPAAVPQGVVEVVVDNGASVPARCGVLNGNEVYINCGGDEFTDTAGRVWSRDTLGNPSPFLTSPNAHTADFGNPGLVNLTADPVVAAGQYPADIMPVERWNDGPIEYTIPGFPTGNYEVTLLFMEGCCSDGCEDIPDPALSASPGGCRVFDILINDQLVEDQFSQNVLASQEGGVPPGVTANYIAVARVYQVSGVNSIKILIDDLGPGNPPENASIKGIGIKPVGGALVVFHRGDADNNGSLQLTDAVRILNFLFLGTGKIDCMDAADADNNGKVQLTDAVRILNVLFLGQGSIPDPAPPGASFGNKPCGPDPGAATDHIGCAKYDQCRA